MLSIKKILVPTDFSENSASIFPLVLRTLKDFGAKVDIIHVVPTSPYFQVAKDALSSFFGGGNKSQSDEELKTHLLQKLNDKLEAFPEENRGQVFLLEEGRPEAKIVEHIKAQDYDMVMVASRGMGNSLFSRGSVAEGLIQLSPIPVLSSHRDIKNGISNIIFPTDGSKNSFEALATAILFAEKYKSTIQLLGVVEFDRTDTTLTGQGSRMFDYAIEQFTKDIYKHLEEYVEAQADLLSFETKPTSSNPSFKIKTKNENSITLSLHFKEGVSAYSTVVAYAMSYGQLVVMTTHGRSGLAHLFMGSTAEKVARNLEMPVITVKPEGLKK